MRNILALLFTIATGMVFAQEEILKFTEVSGGYQVAGISSSVTIGDVTIPDRYNGKPVVAIARGGFQNMSRITGINIPNNVRIIPDDAFRGTSVSRIEIPDSVTEIGISAFRNCTSLETIKMGDNVTTIGTSAFQGCSSLWAFDGTDIGGKVRTIGTSAFEGCRSLQNVLIRASVQIINDSAFRGCNALERVNFQQAAVRIGANAFPGDLADVYKAGGAGPYDVATRTRTTSSSPVTWVKGE